MTTIEATSASRLSVLRDLAAFRATDGLVVSLTFGFYPSATATGDEAATRLASLLQLAKRDGQEAAGRLGRAERLAFARDLTLLREHITGRPVPASIACFADEPDGLWRSLEVSGPLPDVVRVGRAPYLVPLAEAPPDDEALFVSVGREQGEIYELHPSGLTKVVDLFQEQPQRHRDGHAWQQPSLERHVDELARKHLGRVAADLEYLLRARPSALVVLAGEQEHTAALEHMLSPSARAAIAGTVHPEAHAGTPDLAQLASPVLERRAEEDERAVVERWRAAVGRADGGVEGWPDTLAAASEGRVGLLLFRGGIDRPAFECPAFECPSCGRASATAGVCPVDGRPLEQQDGIDLAIRLTFAHGGGVQAVRGHLGAAEIGALLAY